MSSDPSVPEVTAKTENISSKRAIEDNVPTKVDSEDACLHVPTANTTEDVENPPKRIKVEEQDTSATLPEKSLSSADTNDSTSTGPSPPLPTNCNKGEGDNVAHVGSGDISPAHSNTSGTGAGDTTKRRENVSEFPNVTSPAVTRSRSASTDGKNDKGVRDTSAQSEAVSSISKDKPKGRWRVHQMAEDYINLVGSMMYPATQFQPYGYNPEERQYPIEKISMLGFVKSPLRRPTIIEKWSPYEIAIFEGSMLHYGKEFRNVSRQIGTKTTQEVIDFYYIWKKTAHYKKWKEQYISDEDLIDDFYVPPKKTKR